MTTQYRKKPIAIEAVQFLGIEGKQAKFNEAAPEWYDRALASGTVTLVRNSIEIRTLAHTLYVLPGDWLARGALGELYPIPAQVFAATYEVFDAEAETPVVAGSDGVTIDLGEAAGSDAPEGEPEANDPEAAAQAAEQKAAEQTAETESKPE